MTQGSRGWMIDDVTTVPGVLHAVVLSTDGLAQATSEGTPKDAADRLAAACSALQSLGRSIDREFGGNSQMREAMMRLSDKLLFIRRAAQGSMLAVVTESTVDPDLIAQQMQLQVNTIGEGLGMPHPIGTCR